MIWKRLLRKLRQWRGIHSQGDEQQILEALFADQACGTYIDVGAHHPVTFSNTYWLYRRGWRGLCLEPNAALHDRFQRVRPGDRLITAAAGTEDGEAWFHLGHHDVHGSLAYAETRHQGRVRVPVRRLDTILRDSAIAAPDLLSIDTEGTEIAVLEGLNLQQNRPRIIVAEYNTAGRINLDLQPYLVGHGYGILAMTCWNVIATDALARDYRILCPRWQRSATP